jgi:anti-sigma-K factor RskA
MSTEKLTREELAIDYVLGMAEGQDHERALRLIASDALFNALVATWREKLGEIDRTAPQNAPVELTWDKLEKGLTSERPQPATRMQAAGIGHGLAGALWQSLGFWRPTAVAAGVASLMLAGGLLRERAKPPQQPIYVAVLQTDQGRASAVVNAFADGTVTLVPIETIGVPEGRILEVWTLQTRERGPVSVGRMDRARTLKLNLGDLRRPDAGHLFEITVEPPGGSPTGRPTGPVLMKGLAGQAL